MNIKQAKDQIKKAIDAYLTKDDSGNYIIPIEKQRPIFVMGPPGIGKTAIMSQIANEKGIGLVPYSMTHHTRQSAIGLPYFEDKIYNGQTYKISQYTMSEIISSIYSTIEESGKKEGILFLDEVNCVSETLAPVMLQFLQYKVFGGHQVPAGWVVVTAGNPPEYNNSVREFDVVTWDRLKRIDVEPDFSVWKEYALNNNVHPSIIAYLESQKDDFYDISRTVDGRQFVTARGWEDLSEMIRMYELHKFDVDESLVSQYLQNKTIAHRFAIYYDLFKTYKKDYPISSILDGNLSDEVINRVSGAAFDEKYAVISLLEDSIYAEMRVSLDLRNTSKLLSKTVSELKKQEDKTCYYENYLKSIQDDFSMKKRAGCSNSDALRKFSQLSRAIIELAERLKITKSDDSLVTIAKQYSDQKRIEANAHALTTRLHLENAFKFCERAFLASGQEIAILENDMTANPISMAFIQKYGCEMYYKNIELVMLSKEELKIKADLERVRKANINI